MEKIQTVPIIISITGAVQRNLVQNIKELGLSEHLYKTMQKSALLAKAHSVRKFMKSCRLPQLERSTICLKKINLFISYCIYSSESYFCKLKNAVVIVMNRH